MNTDGETTEVQLELQYAFCDKQGYNPISRNGNWKLTILSTLNNRNATTPKRIQIMAGKILPHIEEDTTKGFLTNIWRDSRTGTFKNNDTKWAKMDEIKLDLTIWPKLRKWPQNRTVLYTTVIFEWTVTNVLYERLQTFQTSFARISKCRSRRLIGPCLYSTRPKLNRAERYLNCTIWRGIRPRWRQEMVSQAQIRHSLRPWLPNNDAKAIWRAGMFDAKATKKNWEDCLSENVVLEDSLCKNYPSCDAQAKNWHSLRPDSQTQRLMRHNDIEKSEMTLNYTKWGLDRLPGRVAYKYG